MSRTKPSAVMDVLPWPRGRGFTGAGAWWKDVLSRDEGQRLDNLMGMALLDEDICQRLVHGKDDSLMAAFSLSKEMQVRLRTTQVSSLAELAQALTPATQNGNR